MCYKIMLITSTNYLAIDKMVVVIRQITSLDATNVFFSLKKKLKFFYKYPKKLWTPPKLFVRFYFIPHYEYK